MNRHIVRLVPAARRPGPGTRRCVVALYTVVLAAMALIIAASCSRPAHVVWQRRYDSGREDFGSSVVADSNDVIVGTTSRNTSAGPLRTDWEILRYDRNGDLKWQRTYRRGKRDSLSAIAVGTDHDIVAVGCTGSNAAGDSARLLLAKFSAQGDLKWDREHNFGRATRGTALTIDSIGRITVCGSVVAEGSSATSDILLARFDSLGNRLDHETLDFGADESGQDVIQILSRRVPFGPVFVVGERTPLPGRTDSLSTRDILVICLDPDRNVLWRQIYNSGGDDLQARVAVTRSQDVFVVVTARNDKGVSTHLLEYGYRWGTLLRDTRYPGAPNASCLALTAERGGAILGVGAAGPDGQQRGLGWRYLRGKFSTFLPGNDTLHGANARADDITLDADGNVVTTGVSDPGTHAGILITKLALPRYTPPPNLPWGTGGGPN